MKNISKQKPAQDDSWLSEADMSNTNTNLKTQIALIDKLKPQMAIALPKHMNSDRLARIALTEMRQTPLLQQCEPASLMKCLMVSAQLGLEPGVLGHCNLIPYRNKKNNTVECNLIIGYKGMLDLARRSGQVESIEARTVCENDVCEVRYGLDSTIEHRIDIKNDRGQAIGYYAIAKLAGGGKQFEFLTKYEVEKVRQNSPNRNSGPWQDHFDEMAKKTVIRRLFKYLPVSIEMQKAINVDEHGDAGIQNETIENDFFEVDQETGEVLAEKPKQADELAEKLK